MNLRRLFTFLRSPVHTMVFEPSTDGYVNIVLLGPVLQLAPKTSLHVPGILPIALQPIGSCLEDCHCYQ